MTEDVANDPVPKGTPQPSPAAPRGGAPPPPCPETLDLLEPKKPCLALRIGMETRRLPRSAAQAQEFVEEMMDGQCGVLLRRDAENRLLLFNTCPRSLTALVDLNFATGENRIERVPMGPRSSAPVSTANATGSAPVRVDVMGHLWN